MTKRPFSKNPDYLQSILGLHRLHALGIEGKNESPEADEIRDRIEYVWESLPQVERKRIDGLSADLYSISDPVEKALPTNPQVQARLVEAIEAKQAGDWDRALEILRRWARYLEPALLSYMRGAIWRAAGDASTAVLFFEHAARLEPNNGNYVVLYLNELERTEPAVALRRAREILESAESSSPEVVVRGVAIQYAAARRTADPGSRSVFHELTRILERTLERLKVDQERIGTSYNIVLIMAFQIMALCRDQLGDLEGALGFYNIGLALAPEDEGLLVGRGILRYGRSRSVADAASDFEQAIRLGSSTVWPYFYLAHHYLSCNRFDECRKMCERALSYPAPDPVRSNLHEWLAISKAEQGFPLEQVRAEFEDALRLDPENERIRRNLKHYEEIVAGPSDAQSDWERPAPSVVQAFGHAEYQPPLAA